MARACGGWCGLGELRRWSPDSAAPVPTIGPGGDSCCLSVLLFGHLGRFGGARQSVPERLPGSASVHASALVGPLPVVGHEVLVGRDLHLVDSLEPGASSFNPEVLVEERAVEPLHDAIGLWPVDLRLRCSTSSSWRYSS